MLPRSTGVIVGVENKMVDAKAQQVKRRGKPGRAGADDDVVEDLHDVFNNQARRAIPTGATESGEDYAVSWSPCRVWAMVCSITRRMSSGSSIIGT